MITFCLFLLSTLPISIRAVDPLVALDYASYRGVALSNVTQWLGIRYAAPPVGHLRFAAPNDPVKETSTIDADEHGSLCLPTNGSSGSVPDQAEDCLFLDVYAPSDASSQGNDLLPVFVFIQGGGFNANSNANYNGTGLIEASGGKIVIVNFNYRVGPYGFLASQEIVKGGSLNNGLKDQRKVLQWVQKYISKFGGNPEHVTIGGDSAGAISLTLHLTAYGGRNDNLFHATAAESQGMPSLNTVAESQYQYDALVQRANCNGKSDTLACLRGLSADQLQAINFNIASPGATGPPLYMYTPTLDFDFVTNYTYYSFKSGKFLKLPAIYGDDTNEGTIFTPKNTNDQQASDTFLKNQFSALTSPQLQQIHEYYPLAGTPSFIGAGRFWRQVSNAYGEMRYICPGLFISNTYGQALVNNWNYRWNIIESSDDDDGYGVTHTIETGAIWGPDYVTNKVPDSYYPDGANGAIVPLVQSYWISFIRSYDPNRYRMAGAPLWRPFVGSSPWPQPNSMQRLLFQTNATRMESVPGDQRTRCQYLWGIGPALKQ